MRCAAESAFSAGPLAIGARPVPIEVLTALRAGARDDNPRVALEALYAFGALAVEPSGDARRELLRATGPDARRRSSASSDPAHALRGGARHRPRVREARRRTSRSTRRSATR